MIRGSVGIGRRARLRILCSLRTCGFKSHLPHYITNIRGDYAGVAELADAQASGACGSNIVWVQVPSPAFLYVRVKEALRIRCFFFFLSQKTWVSKGGSQLSGCQIAQSRGPFYDFGRKLRSVKIVLFP